MRQFYSCPLCLWSANCLPNLHYVPLCPAATHYTAKYTVPEIYFFVLEQITLGTSIVTVHQHSMELNPHLNRHTHTYTNEGCSDNQNDLYPVRVGIA